MAETEPAVKLPVMTNGKTLADQAWWNETPESRWGPAPERTYLAHHGDIWARCWAYIDEKNLEPYECRIVWDIAYAAIEAMARTPQADR